METVLRKFSNKKDLCSHNGLSMFRGYFHRTHTRYNIIKSRAFDERDKEYFWRTRSDTSSVNHKDWNVNDGDWEINQRCHKVTGVRCN